MAIPNEVKIGGKKYTVSVTEYLISGTRDTSAEIDFRASAIRVTPQEEQKMKTDFIHELVHGILDHLGYDEHDEQLVDGIANTLFAINVDNPGLFEKLR